MALNEHKMTQSVRLWFRRETNRIQLVAVVQRFVSTRQSQLSQSIKLETKSYVKGVSPDTALGIVNTSTHPFFSHQQAEVWKPRLADPYHLEGLLLTFSNHLERTLGKTCQY